MYHAIIYSRGKLTFQPQPPSTPASAENYGQITSGTHNSTWKSSRRTVIKTRYEWVVITPDPAVPPIRPATADDVGVYVTSQDGSIWTGKQTISDPSNRWVALGSYSSTPGNAIANAPCEVVGAIASGPFGEDDGTGNIRYPQYRCEAGQPAITYSWEFVAIRQICRECPPTSDTLDPVGTECVCSGVVYQLKEVEYSEFEYFWQLLSDSSILTVEASGIVKLENFDITLRAYEDDNGSITGAIDQDLEDPFMFEIRDDRENQIYAGFIKNWKFNNGTVKFNVVDFRSVLNTDILLDYSDGDNDFRLFKIFEKTTNQVKINSRQLLYEFNFPQDETDTKHIADYEGQYILVNAQAFLKVYLSYHNYVIDKRYDYARNTLVFTFRKQTSTPEEIRLDDFEHEKTLNDIKTNRVVATIKFQTIYEADTEWVATDKIAWDTAASENKSTLMAEELPPLDGYTKDHVIRLAKGVHFKTITAAQYNALEVKHEVRIPLTSGATILGEVVEHPDTKHYPADKIVTVLINPIGQPSITPPTEGASCNITNEFIYVYYYIDYSTGGPGRQYIYGIYTCEGYTQYSCPATAPTLEQIEEKFNAKDYPLEAGLKVSWQDSNGQDCGLYTYVQVWSDQVEYYRKGGVMIIPRPASIATKVYSLGSDNNIYEGNAPEHLTLYPVQTKIFENETLAKAQIDAVYHLVANRWNENIILTDQKRPLDLSNLQLINLVRVYDKNGSFKDLPISEKMMTYSGGHLTRKIKLGFKKELFTQIYKSDNTQGVLK